jgi:hypothetical protein
MANKTIIKAVSAIGNTTLYTHTDSTPLLISGVSFNVVIPSYAASPSANVVCDLYLAKKQPDGTYNIIKLDYTFIAGRRNITVQYSNLVLRTVAGYTIGRETYYTDDYLYINADPDSPNLSVSVPNSFYYEGYIGGYTENITTGTLAAYGIKQSKVVINTGDIIYCNITGSNQSNLLVITPAITAITLPENRTYKGALFKGLWVSGRSYEKNDSVIANNNLYIAIRANSDLSITATNWLLLKSNAINIKRLIFSELTTPSGTVSPLVTETLGISTVLSNKLFVNAKITGQLSGGFNGLTLPPISANTTLISTTNVKTLRNKTINNSEIASNSVVNLFNQTVTIESGYVFSFGGAQILFKPVTKTLTAGINNIFLDNTGGVNFVCQTTTTAGDNFSIVLPSASTSSGYTISFTIKMVAATQNISFDGAKLARPTTASEVANRTDRYLLVCDGTYWYCIQTNKGIL